MSNKVCSALDQDCISLMVAVSNCGICHRQVQGREWLESFVECSHPWSVQDPMLTSATSLMSDCFLIASNWRGATKATSPCLIQGLIACCLRMSVSACVSLTSRNAAQVKLCKGVPQTRSISTTLVCLCDCVKDYNNFVVCGECFSISSVVLFSDTV